MKDSVENQKELCDELLPPSKDNKNESDQHNVDEYFDQNYVDSEFDLEMVLQKYSNTATLLKIYRMQNNDKLGYRKLEESERKLVVKQIIEHFIEKKILLTRKDFPRIFEKILYIFPEEIMFIYYIPPLRKKSSKNSSVKYDREFEQNKEEQQEQLKIKNQNNNPRGCLFNKWKTESCKVRKKLAAAGLDNSHYYRNGVTCKTTSKEGAHFTTENINESKIWLQINFEPWEEIKIKWKETCSLRKQEINDLDFNNIIKNWPRYTKKNGFELIDIDFTHSFPEETNKFKTSWITSTDQLINIAFNKAVKRGEKDANRFSITGITDDDEFNLKCCVALKALFYLSGNKNRRNNQQFEKLLLKLDKNELIQEKIQVLSELTKINKQDYMSPIILFYVDECNMPYKFFVCTNNLVYEFGNFVMALDCLFKCFFVFDLKYPKECLNVMTFIQQFYYNIFLKDDVTAVAITTLMFDVDSARAKECQQKMLEQK